MSGPTVPPDARIRGDAILATLEALGAFGESARRMLAELGITDIRSDAWYPHEAYVRFFEVLQQRTGPNTLLLAGRLVAGLVTIPAEIDSLERVLQAMNTFFHQGRIHFDRSEGWTYQPVGPRSARMTVRSPYPAGYERGVLEGFARAFKPGDSEAISVEPLSDPDAAESDVGGTTFVVKW